MIYGKNSKNNKGKIYGLNAFQVDPTTEVMTCEERVK